MTAPRRTLSLRLLFGLFVLTAAAYLAVITLAVERRVAPTARSLQARGERLLDQHDAIQGRLAVFEASIGRLERLLTVAGPRRASPDTAAVRGIETTVRARLDSMARYLTSEALSGLSTLARLALARATQVESDLGVSLLEATAELAAGDADGARERLRVSDSLRVLTRALLTDVQRRSITEIVQRERELTAAAEGVRRAVLWWLLVGAALAAAGFVVLRIRLYEPLADLDRSLARIADGDLGAEVSVSRDDEMGRLGAHFNKMTSVLRRARADEARSRENLAERLGHLLDESFNEILVLDGETLRVIQANRGALQNLGYSAEELKSLTVLDLLRDADPQAVMRQLAALLTGARHRLVVAATMARRDGTAYPVQMDVQVSSSEQPPVLVATVRDTTVRTEAERLGDVLRAFAVAAPQSEPAGGEPGAGMAAIVETAAQALNVPRASAWLLRGDFLVSVCRYGDGDGAHTADLSLATSEAAEFLAALHGARTVAAHDAAHDPRTESLVRVCGGEPVTTSILAAAVRVGGTLAGTLCFAAAGAPRRWSSEEEAFCASMADFASLALEDAERLRAEASLRESEERYRTAFEQAATGITEVAPDGTLLRANASFCRMIGRTAAELVGRPVGSFTHPDDVAAEDLLTRRLLSGRQRSMHWEKRYLHSGGRAVWASVTAAPVRDRDGAVRFFVAIVQDITEHRSLQAQLAQAQKMESIGRLAGGVAHDFNNLLTAILGYLDLATSSIGPEHPLQDDLREVRRAADRASALTRQLLTFARRQVVEPKVVDLNALTLNLDKMLRRLIGEDIELVTALQPRLGSVRVDPGQFEQVIVNLAVNARDAMPRGGKLTIETAGVELDEAYAASRPDVRAGRYVRLSVTDTGGGMGEEVLAHLFEPFFTTKERGRGTGLGLSTCYGIVRQAGGHIGVYSEPGVGTSFKVYLPLAEERAEGSQDDAAEEAVPRGHETVLLVEDEDQVRTLMERTLRANGYRVLTATNGEEALAASRRHEGRLHLLISDVILPLLGGPELAETLRHERPDLRVLFMSGYTEGAVFRNGVLEAGTDFLSKPFMPGDLVRRVRTVLDRDS